MSWVWVECVLSCPERPELIMGIQWIPRFGKIDSVESKIEFHGGMTTTSDGRESPEFANVLSSHRVSDGYVRAKVTFADTSKANTACILLRDNPATGAFLVVGFTGGEYSAYGIRVFDGTRWNTIACGGEWRSVKAGQQYVLEASIDGTIVSLSIDGIPLLQSVVPHSIPISNVGIWCQGATAIRFDDFQTSSRQPTAFIVMQFGAPYDELFDEVIDPVCNQLKISAFRSDAEYGPGLIIQDITRRLTESALVIAEITPTNSNVYYEVGYAHALRKPVILLAERGKQLPFDISGMRVVFYDNTISGKRCIEKELDSHIRAILSWRGEVVG